MRHEVLDYLPERTLAGRIKNAIVWRCRPATLPVPVAPPLASWPVTRRPKFAQGDVAEQVCHSTRQNRSRHRSPLEFCRNLTPRNKSRLAARRTARYDRTIVFAADGMRRKAHLGCKAARSIDVAISKRGFAMTPKSWISWRRALIALALIVAPPVPMVHAVRHAHKVSVVSFGLFGDQGVFRSEATGAAQVVAGRFGRGPINVRYNSKKGGGATIQGLARALQAATSGLAGR